MKRLYLLLALLLAAAPAFAQSEGAVTPGNRAPRSTLQGCTYTAAGITATDQQQMATQCDPNGNQKVTIGGGTGSGTVGNNIDTVATTTTGNLPAVTYNYVYDSVTGVWQRQRAGGPTTGTGQLAATGVTQTQIYTFNSTGQLTPVINPVIASDSNNGANLLPAGLLALNPVSGNYNQLRTLGSVSPGILGIGISPNPDVTGAILPVATTTSGSQFLQLKSSAGNLYSVQADNASQTLSGRLIIVNATTTPAFGALASGLVLDCVALMTSGQLGSSAKIDYGSGPPQRYTAGVIALLSASSSCGTYTPLSMSGFISGRVQ